MKILSLGITLLTTLCIFVLGALLMNFVVMPLCVHDRNSVIVPDVRLTSKQQAEKTLRRLSLEIFTVVIGQALAALGVGWSPRPPPRPCLARRS